MPLFRKRPIVVEAEQHHGPMTIISTLEGDLFVFEGDWVITGVEGEKYPCKDHIFRKTYEPLDGGDMLEDFRHRKRKVCE